MLRPGCAAPLRRRQLRGQNDLFGIPLIQWRVRSQNVLTRRIENLEDVPSFTPVGGPHKVTATGSAHNQKGQLRKNDPETLRQLRHLEAKVSSRASSLERVRWDHRKGARALLVSFGISARTCRQVAAELSAAGTPVSLLEILSLEGIHRFSNSFGHHAAEHDQFILKAMQFSLKTRSGHSSSPFLSVAVPIPTCL